MVVKAGSAIAAVALLLLWFVPCSEGQYRTLKPAQPHHGQHHKANNSGAGQHAADASGDGRKRASNGGAAAQGQSNGEHPVQYSRGSAPPLLVQQAGGQPGATACWPLVGSAL